MSPHHDEYRAALLVQKGFQQFVVVDNPEIAVRLERQYLVNLGELG